jgi:arylsulfatase A-like enzyme
MKHQTKPNIIFVFADQLRQCSLGYAGEEDVITPNLDRFARENSYFETAVSISPVCTPYRGSLLTGRAPTSTGLVLNDIALSTDEISIAHAAKAGGYDTAYIGKWHLDGPDRKAWVPPGSRRQGFDYWVGANFEHNYDNSIYFQDTDNPLVWEGFDAAAQTSHMIEYLKSRNSTKPLCLFLSWGPPHHPYNVVPGKYLDMYKSEEIRGRPNCPEVPRQDLQGYYAQTTFLDDQFGKLVQALDELGIRENTILVFSSDHGDMHGSHGLYKKQWPWDECIKVPFLLSYPKAIQPGTVFRFPINAIDVMPTLLGLAGVNIPETVEGVDLSPYIRGEKDDPPESVMFMNPCSFEIGDARGEDQYPTYRGRQMQYRGLRTNRYTYVRTIEGPWLLYDNLTDPYQMNNLIDREQMNAVQDRLETLLQEHMQRIGDDILPNETYYKKFDLTVDERGKITGIVENPYDLNGNRQASWKFKE